MSKHKIYLSNPEENQPPQKQRGGIVSFFVILICLGLFFISPLPKILFALIPNSVITYIISPVFKNVTLDKSKEQLSSPKKYQIQENMPVLGRDSGVCFTFEHIDETRKKEARRGHVIAEIIAVSPEKKEYTLDEVTLDKIKKREKNNAQNSNIYIICQKFSRNISIIPDEIKAIYIRPLKPFTPLEIIWATKKDINDIR